ncbi:hypothetical protein GUJ93_ZPchr0007g3284 [Zizania palustris]|uniref:DUF632 domain-containing protein n=1 Tax=Zizania palustris TaxID=103762 RepID=A0A8J5W4R5_ZIZPA|nr:hypothetical protein GUJ93_ZPchr0007g3284 [Zizania palustris]KAG8079265.1 hypothetical protein GUJ93_ZPchr0007g3284 [Zizania palustris]
MGVAPSKIEYDKVLMLCQERRRFVREAIDGRCALAAAHCDYVQSLRDTGFLLRKCFEPEELKESIPKNYSTFLSLRHASHMKAGRASIKTYQEKVAVPVTMTVASASSQGPTGTPPCDCFDQIYPGGNLFPVQHKNKPGQDFDKVNDLRCLPEEGIPELEEEGQITPSNEDDDFAESKDNFENEEDGFAEPKDYLDNPSAEISVAVSKNHIDMPAKNTSTNQAPSCHDYGGVASKETALSNTDCQSDKPKNVRIMIDLHTNENDGISAGDPVNVIPSSAAAVSMGSTEPYPHENIPVNDSYSCMVEIEILFSRACDSGKEVTRVLDEDKLQFRTLLPEEIAHGSKPSSFIATLFACCREDVPLPETPSQAEVKYLTWHRSVSSQLSPSRNPPGTNALMHTSTLDKLYAWEGKLYDEVKANSAICRRYDEKCKQLRDQESRGKNQIHVDFTRATVKDLYSRILVAIQKIDFISKNIEDIRDKELQPQMDELIGSLTRMWATMLECHQLQYAIIKLVSSKCSMKLSFQSDSQCQYALLLSAKLSKLCSDFQNWVSTHKAYLSSLNLWLHKCMKPLKRRKISKKQNVVDVSLTECAVAPIFITCETWLKCMDDLPTNELVKAMDDLIADVGGEILRNNAPADLQSSLKTFLEKLEDFSVVSLQKYIDLQKNINTAKERLLRED